MKKSFFLFSCLIFSVDLIYSDRYVSNLIEYLCDLDVVKEFQNDFIELNINKVFIDDNQVRLLLSDVWIVDLPKVNILGDGLYLDSEGIFLLCKSITEEKIYNFELCAKKEMNLEAFKHYQEARSHGWDFLGHSLAAGSLVEIPPLAVIESFNAVQSLKKMADEYLKAWDIEHNKNSHVKSDWRDHEDNSQAGGSNCPYEQNK